MATIPRPSTLRWWMMLRRENDMTFDVAMLIAIAVLVAMGFAALWHDTK